MEMDSVEVGHDEDCILEDASASPLLSQGSDTVDIFAEPVIFARVGEEYQVQIPPLLTESERLQLMRSPCDTELNVDHAFAMGLPITISWVHNQVENVKHGQTEFLGDRAISQDVSRLAESGKRKKGQMKLNGEHLDAKVENSNVQMSCRKRSGTVRMRQAEDSDQDQKYSLKDYSPLPAFVCSSSWTDLEVESFLLGLYIFDKNLDEVKRFVETKGMGDVLSYYYGKFYRSDTYRRWSQCRKMSSRKCIYGPRIFTGWRQHVLLSRLFPQVSKESQNSLVEVTKAFSDGKILLEGYVSSLKGTVGMTLLIDAIGIGKGKRDLTGIVDPIKTNQVISLRQEIPTGKELNSLSSRDIIKFLTGDFRLSKAKSSDLFWEAVWPRLLDRGWHSEQPKNQNYAGSKNSLVFLIPGVKKFSRKRLVKGNHYFDSVTDVLNKVASDPTLLDAEAEAEVPTPRGYGSNEENGWNAERKSGQDGCSDHQRLCYLQPKTSNCNPDVMFTIVDTSLCKEGPSNIRELRTLPAEMNINSSPTSSETGSGSSEDETELARRLSNDHVGSSTSRPKDSMFAMRACITSDGLRSTRKRRKPTNGMDRTNMPVDNHEDQYANTCTDKNPKKTVKRQLSRRAKPGQSDYLSPVTKRRRLTACERDEKSLSADVFPGGSGSKQKDPRSSTGASENMAYEVGPSQDKVYAGCSSKDMPKDRSDGIHIENHVKKAEPRALIDLNLPHVEEDDDAFIEDRADSQGDLNGKGWLSLSGTNHLDDSQTPKSTSAVISDEQQPEMNGRRQSTRNRPLTTKALEALANGFLSNTPKRKHRKGTEDTIPRPSRRVRRRNASISVDVVTTGLVDPKLDEGVDEASSSNTRINMVSNPQVQSERKVALELLGDRNPDYHYLADKGN